jgi:hypothetical protein
MMLFPRIARFSACASLAVAAVLLSALRADASSITVFDDAAEFFANVGPTVRYPMSGVPSLTAFTAIDFGFYDGTFRSRFRRGYRTSPRSEAVLNFASPHTVIALEKSRNGNAAQYSTLLPLCGRLMAIVRRDCRSVVAAALPGNNAPYRASTSNSGPSKNCKGNTARER